MRVDDLFEFFFYSISVDTTILARGQLMLSQLPKLPQLLLPTPKLTHGCSTTTGAGPILMPHTGTTHTGEDTTTLARGQLMLSQLPKLPQLLTLKLTPGCTTTTGDGLILMPQPGTTHTGEDITTLESRF